MPNSAEPSRLERLPSRYLSCQLILKDNKARIIPTSAPKQHRKPEVDSASNCRRVEASRPSSANGHTKKGSPGRANSRLTPNETRVRASHDPPP